MTALFLAAVCATIVAANWRTCTVHEHVSTVLFFTALAALLAPITA